jgi:hypothetical protein
MTLKEKFINETQKKDIKYLIVAVKLPTGAIEVITNTQEIGTKIEYYTNAYNEEFKLKTNTNIEIINFMIV